MNKLLTNPLTGITNDINSIKTELDNAISNPYIGTFEATDFKTQDVISVETAISDLNLLSNDVVYTTVSSTQILTGDIQIPMGETSALIGQNLYDLNSTSTELLGKTVNIDNSTFTDYTRINGNLQTGLLTVKRDDGAAVSANTFEIKDALNDVIYSINGLGQQIGDVFTLQNGANERNLRFRTNYTPVGGLPYYAGITSTGYGTFNTELPVMTWSCYDGTDGFKNTEIVNFYAGNIQMMQLNASDPADLKMTISAANTIITGKINSVTPAGGVFSQIATKTNTGSTAEQVLTSTGIGSLVIPANIFTQGASYCLTIGGLKTNNNNDTIEIRLKSGATVLASTGAISLSALSNAPYDVEINFTIQQTGILGTGLIHYAGFLSYTDAGAYRGANFSGLNTLNTTGNNTLSVVSVQSDATNTITCSSLILTKIF